MALVLFLDKRRATAEEDNCYTGSAVGHHIRLSVEQNSYCSSSLHHLEHLVARTVFEDTYWLPIEVPVGHSQSSYVGCTYLTVDLLAYDHSSARL